MSRRQNDAALTAMVEEIERYLTRYPEAADTLEGIAYWWLTPGSFNQAWNTLQEALDHLVAAGVLGQYTTAEGKTVYFNARNNTKPSD